MKWLPIRSILITAIVAWTSLGSMAQDESSIWNDMSLTGYVKNLTTVFLPPGGDTSIFVDNLIHNRLDYAWYINSNFTLNASMRNRLFYGESVKTLPVLYDQLAEDPAYFDFSILWFNSKGAALHTTFDRLNIDFQKNNWQFIVGRQRINWGVNLIWNPNDIFNAFSYFDFDYEERIGTDAILTRRYISATSTAELVYAPGDSLEASTISGMYKVLVGSYDLQVIAGYLFNQMVIGGGWAGDIEGAGFRGEFTLFAPLGDDGRKTQFVGAIDVDYTFPNTLYLHASYMFNSLGLDTKTGDYTNFFIGTGTNISAQTLSPAMHNIFFESTYSLSPIVRVGFATWFNPSDYSLFLGPSVNWSIAQNFEVLFNVQGFVGKDMTLFGNYGSFYYLRFKYSF